VILQTHAGDEVGFVFREHAAWMDAVRLLVRTG